MLELKYLQTNPNGYSYCSFPYYWSDKTTMRIKNLWVPVQPTISTSVGCNVATEGPGRFQAAGNGVDWTAPQSDILKTVFKFAYVNSNASVRTNYYTLEYETPNGIDGNLEIGNAYMKLNNSVIVTATTYTGSITLTQPFYLFSHFNWPHNYIVSGHCGQVEFEENGVVVARYTPYLDDNGRAGFLDENNQTMIYSLQNDWVAGPFASSIIIAPNKKIIASTGGTIPITISSENDWTAVGTDGSWYTLSSTGGTSADTGITITVPSYTGATERTDTITFTDTTTSDTDTFELKQKKYIDGQPFYLGGNEVTECYLGGSSVSEAYLGESLVYSAGSPAPTPTGGSINITITGATSACIGDPYDGGCKPYSSITFNLHNDCEGEDSAWATLENIAYMPGGGEVMWELVDSGITREVTSITYDDTTDTLTFIGEFDTGCTYYVRCMATELDERFLYMGEAYDENYETTFDGSTSVTLSPDLGNEYDPLRTLIITGVTFPSDLGETLAISDNEKFYFEATWDSNEMTYDTSNSWLAEDWFTIDYDDTEGEVRITADWILYSEGSEYTLDSKFETMGQCMDPAQQSLIWADDEFEQTMTFEAGTPCGDIE